MEPCKPLELPLQHIDWEGLMSSAGRANRALARYDGLLDGIPNPEVLLAPFTKREAVLSSRIEGTQATLGDVYQFEAGDEPADESRKHDIFEVINYRRAMALAEESLETRPFNLNLLKQLHAVLLDSVRGRDKGRGQFRRIQNWIGAHGASIDNAVFVPPRPEDVPGLLDNWEKYYHIDRPDYLVQLAILHAQFEMIHPFLDGNGRLGRMIIPLFLFEKRILQRPTFYLSGWLETNKEEYMDKLRPLGIRKGAWEEWIRFFLRGIEEEAANNSQKTRDIMTLYQETKKQSIELTHSQYAVPLVDEFFVTPVFISTKLKLKVPSILSLLSKLEKGGVISILSPKSGRRPARYVFQHLLNLCGG